MKGVSEAVVIVIIAAVLITVSLTVFYFSLSSLEYSTITSEYSYIRTVFTNLANRIPDVLNGAGFGSGLPKRMVGVGYLSEHSELPIDYYDIEITVYGDNGVLLTYTDNPIRLYAKTNTPIITRYRLIHGTNERVVRDTQLLVRVSEYYYRGSTYLVLDSARVYIGLYEYNYIENNVVKKVLSIQALYVKLNVHIVSSNPTSLSANRGVDIINERFVDIADLRLRFSNATYNEEIGLAQLVNTDVWNQYEHIILTLIVREINVVLS